MYDPQSSRRWKKVEKSEAVGLATLILLLLIGIANAQNEVYLLPQDSNTSYCNTAKVQIWANTSDDFGGGKINLTYSPSCANVTDWEFGPVWIGGLLNDWDSDVEGVETITFTRPFQQPEVNGTVLIGNLTIHCCNERGCGTSLKFSPPSKLSTPGGEIIVTWQNGTFRCGTLSSCLGTCCNDSACNETYLLNVSCQECKNLSNNKYWKPNKDSACFDNYPMADLCLSYCPECCDGIDNNDDDDDIDFPSDIDCTCGLDPSEAYPAAPVPELPTIVLFSLGLLALTGYVLRKRA